MVELDKDGAIPGELPRRRHQHDGHGGESDGEGADGAGHHSRRAPEEDNEFGAEHPGPDPRERTRGFLSVN